MQASKELDKRRETPEQKGSISGTALEEEKSGVEGASAGTDGTSRVVDDAIVRTWSDELGRDLCGVADSQGQTTMSTTRLDEMA